MHFVLADPQSPIERQDSIHDDMPPAMPRRSKPALILPMLPAVIDR
jgi:hypothetical protein